MDRSSKSETDVLVVGGGPTGLVMAAELAARGIGCRIIDKAPVRSQHTRALVVQARSLELLQKMGIADELVARGRRTIKATPFVDGRRALDLEFGDIGVDDTPYPFLLFVSQAETERVLEEHLEGLGVKVERPVELLTFTQDSEGANARLSHGDGREETVRARYIVGADGAHSVVRKTVGLSFEGEAYPQDFVLADVELDWEGEDGRLYAFLSREGLLAVFPLAGPSTYRLMATRAEDAPADAGDPTLEEFQQLATELSALPMRLHDPGWLARFRLHHRGVNSYRAGRAFVAGDAAHIHSPAGGQGMNTGIQDAYNLAWKLALALRGRVPDSFLDSYHDERYPVGRRLLRTTDRMFNLAATQNPLLTALRNFLIPRVVPRIMGKRSRRARAFRFVSQLGIKYPDSPIVGEELHAADRAFRHGPAAGHRAPDGSLRLVENGRTVSLFSRLRDTPHHLLLFSGPGGRDLSDGDLRGLVTEYEGLLEPHLIFSAESSRKGVEFPAYVDDSGLVYERYGLRGDGCYLIRPDGYIAFRAPGSNLRPLRAYLQKVFAASPSASHKTRPTVGATPATRSGKEVPG
jgi:2-polyprenyl-6-methoxyphenol hydroxylase-like FAD-dependent oxidoreductase